MQQEVRWLHSVDVVSLLTSRFVYKELGFLLGGCLTVQNLWDIYVQ